MIHIHERELSALFTNTDTHLGDVWEQETTQGLFNIILAA